jgi:glycosyltransferase involved in cell wall biosynthesis
MKITAILIVKNEEEKIKDALESLDWADEVIVIDSGSDDKTVSIAKGFGAKIFESSKTGYSDLRNLGWKKAAEDWILYVDADERVTPLLRKEIQGLSNNELSAYAIPRKNFVLGQYMRWGGLWPDYVKRLFRKENFNGWTGELHEEPHFQGVMGYLKNPLIHLKHDNFEGMVDKTNAWSEIEARLMFGAQHPPMNVLRFFSAAFREFWLRFVRQLAFLDGAKGVMYGLYQVFSRLISYTKLWEMQLKGSKQ